MARDGGSIGRTGGRNSGGIVAACTAALAVVGSSVGLAAASPTVPAKDSFTGTITAATGAFARDRGGVSIVLVPGAGTSTRRLAVTIRGTRCRVGTHCVVLTGKLAGTIVRGPLKVPDVGQSFAIRATGTVSPLGHAVATGTVHGTGFIARGEETLQLKLVGSKGTVTIVAHSGLVPGFTSP